jgi:hypothetical protein
VSLFFSFFFKAFSHCLMNYFKVLSHREQFDLHLTRPWKWQLDCLGFEAATRTIRLPCPTQNN